MKKFAILVIALLALTTTSAQAATQQSQRLTATASTQTWTSSNIPGVVYVYITDRRGEVEQSWASGCKALYNDPILGLFVKVQIRGCMKPGSHPFTVRYYSRGGRQTFTFEQTRSKR